MEDELKELEENKSKIDKEIEELEVRLAEEQEFSDYDDADTVERRIAPIQKELVEMKKLQKFAEERLIGIKRDKQNIVKKKVQEIFTTDSIKDPETHKRWLKRGRERALLLVEALKQGIKENDKKNLTTQQINENLKKLQTSETDNAFRKETERMNKYNQEHWEPLVLYLYECEQINDLSDEDVLKINEYVRKEKKENPYNQIWEINIEEARHRREKEIIMRQKIDEELDEEEKTGVKRDFIIQGYNGM